MKRQLEKTLMISDFHQVIEFISDTLKKPVILEGEEFQLLAYSSYYIKDFDQANKQTILSKRSPIQILEKFIEDGIIDQLQSITGPFRVGKIEEIGLNHRVVVSTQHKQTIMGYLWVQEIDNPMSEEEIDFLDRVAKHIGKLLFKKNEAKREKDEKKGQFYRHIMSQAHKSDNQLKQEAETLSIVLPAIVQAIVFSLSNKEEEQFESLKETIQSYLNVTECVTELLVESSKIIVILGDSLRKSIVAEQALDLVYRIIKSFKQHSSANIYVGIGNDYPVSLLRKSYTEALEVIQAADFLGNQENMPYEYNKLGIYRYVQPLAIYNNEVQYVNHDLIKLKKKDMENQTELLKTLEAYLANNCRSKQTAEQLFIHPNTLNYRLKQIVESTSIDLTDFNMNCQLFLDLLLMKRDLS